VRILIIGGGAGGYFAAITAAELLPKAEVTIAEAGARPLRKVEISGGGRCNVTHACFEAKELTQAYPRGQKELRGTFSRFQPKDTLDWFESRGVRLKTEADGRVFPVTDSSSTIVDCFERLRKELGIDLELNSRVKELVNEPTGGFMATVIKGKKQFLNHYDTVILASGSTTKSYDLAKALGHTIEPLAPSLFTFKVKDPRIENLSGLSVEDAKVELSVTGSKKHTEQGPLLITHWGFSGPAVIRLSAWRARELLASNYQAKLSVNWLPSETRQSLEEKINTLRGNSPRKSVVGTPAGKVPKRLWQSLALQSGISKEINYSELSKKMSVSLASELLSGIYQISGKGVFKEEFVTCGGIRLSEVDFRTMESKVSPGLYFSGEVLDIDGITGGYNFQSAWTTGFIAGTAIGNSIARQS